MGPSGCGKTTLLRILAGLEKADGGTISGLPVRVSMAFQEDRLAEPFSAVHNIMLVTGRSVSRTEILSHLEELGLDRGRHELRRCVRVGRRRGGFEHRDVVLRREDVFDIRLDGGHRSRLGEHGGTADQLGAGVFGEPPAQRFPRIGTQGRSEEVGKVERLERRGGDRIEPELRPNLEGNEIAAPENRRDPGVVLLRVPHGPAADLGKLPEGGSFRPLNIETGEEGLPGLLGRIDRFRERAPGAGWP